MKMTENIHWFGQAAVKITTDGKVIYIDPYQLKKADKADIILITHSHGDHLSPADIKKVATDKTVIIATPDCATKLKDIKKSKLLTSEPGFSTTIGDITIEAVPAYNVKKTKFHPKSNKWVGYVVTVNGVKIYHAGDTERVPEMKNIDCDIAMLPLGQTYTMSGPEEAAEAVKDVKAEIAIPIHFGMYEGKESDAETFKKLLEGTAAVIIKKPE
jgi:L-ascorbate metabolism protein UlaG (beta-lactamase superfamily)